MAIDLKAKSGKRELAFIFSSILVYSIYKDNVAMVEVIVWPIMSFIAASAGLHIYGESNKSTRVTSTTDSDSLQSP